MKRFAFFPELMALLFSTGLTGCAVTAPVQGTTQVSHREDPALPGDALVSVGPRRLLEHLSNRISSAAPQLKLVDGLRFRDTAFPQGGWRLRDLLETGSRTRLVRELGVDHLVLVSQLEYTVGEESGFLVPLVAGAQSADHKATLSATVYNLKSGLALRRIDSVAIGKERVYSYVILFSGTTPHVVTPLLDAMVKEIVDTLGTVNGHGASRIAILAAETPEAGN
jgi:hypothetical protein